MHGGAVNKQLDIVETVKRILLLNKYFKRPRFYVEQVAYQRSLVQLLEQSGEIISVKGVRPSGDKRERLAMIAFKIANIDILFENKGCEELITQLVNFGIAAHDDLVDALTLAIIAYENDEPEPRGGMSWGSYHIGPNGGIAFGLPRRRRRR